MERDLREGIGNKGGHGAMAPLWVARIVKLE